jgi:RNA polymerase sigma-70 factor (ECF subfamily)
MAVTAREDETIVQPPTDPYLEDVRAAVSGDAVAVRAVVLRLLPRVRNLVRFLSRGDQDTDDVAQDALLAVLRDLASYREESRFEAWADRVVSRIAIAAARGRRARVVRTTVGPMELTLVKDPTVPPDEYTARRDVVRLLDELPNEQREVLVLHYLLGLTVSEVAVEVGAPCETVRSRIRLAKARLRELAIADSEKNERQP